MGKPNGKEVIWKRKKKKGGKVGPIYAHGGVRHKKGINQARSETKSPVCVYTHTAYVGWCIGGPPRSHLIVQCNVDQAALPSPKLRGRQGKRKFTNCAFTSALSFNSRNKPMVCVASSNGHHCEVLVKCKKW
jgi:hypothetical protein